MLLMVVIGVSLWRNFQNNVLKERKRNWQATIIFAKSAKNASAAQVNPSRTVVPRGGDTLDVGFRVFKLDTSNLKKWQPDDSKPIKQLLLDAENNVLPDRSEEDVLYEIILKLGYDLSCSIEEHTIAGTKVFVTAAGALFICLADRITSAVAEGMAKLHQELAPEVWKVVCRDTGFRDDAAKVNVREILKSEGLDEDAFVTL